MVGCPKKWSVVSSKKRRTYKRVSSEIFVPHTNNVSLLKRSLIAPPIPRNGHPPPFLNHGLRSLTPTVAGYITGTNIPTRRSGSDLLPPIPRNGHPVPSLLHFRSSVFPMSKDSILTSMSVWSRSKMRTVGRGTALLLVRINKSHELHRLSTTVA